MPAVQLLMHPAWTVVSEIGHYAPLGPLFLLLWERAHGRHPSDTSVLLVAAMLLSFVADQTAIAFQGSGNTWWTTYLFLPLQAALWMVAGIKHRAFLTVGLALLALVVAASTLKGPLAKPETLAGVVGGFFACFAFWRTRYEKAILVYCGLGMPGLLWLGSFGPSDPMWLWGFGYYQAMRVLGLLLLTWVILREGGPGGHRSMEPSQSVGARRAAAGRPRPEAAFQSVASRRVS